MTGAGAVSPEISWSGFPCDCFRQYLILSTLTLRKGINIMKRTIGNILLAVAIGATSGAAKIPPEVAENRCEGKPLEAACWQKLTNHPECYFWTDGFHRPPWTVTWTGECVEGLAQGRGTLEWTLSDGYLIAKHTGNLKDGKYHGKWEEDQTHGPSATYYRGTGWYVEGVRHGHWYKYYGKGFSAEGPYVDGKRHGLWTEHGDDRFPRFGQEVSKGLYVEGKKRRLWTVTVTRTVAAVWMDKFPFIEALQRLDTTEKKLEHLRSWHHGLAKENGISEINALQYDSLLAMFVLPHIDDEGVLDCKALEADLVETMPGRLEVTEIGYVMFNITVDDACPGIDPGIGCP